MDYSIVVVTYNPEYNKLFQTLESIIAQKKCTFELIIVDDGSKSFSKDKIENWLKERKFNKFKIICNKVNQGTTKNIASVLNLLKGKYVKVISPGDFLYSEDVLFKIKEYMQENKYKIIFGKAVYYSYQNKKIKIYNMHNPLDLKPYIKYNFGLIKKNMLYYRDLILGAAFVCETKLYIDYTNKIVDVVKYNEDLFCLLMIEDNIEIRFWNDYMIYYEYNCGISTSNNSDYLKLLYNDKKNFFKKFNYYSEFNKIYNIFYGKYSKLHIIPKLKRKIKMLLLKYKINNEKQQIDDRMLNSILKGR